jgi:hypothetical protein
MLPCGSTVTSVSSPEQLTQIIFAIAPQTPTAGLGEARRRCNDLAKENHLITGAFYSGSWCRLIVDGFVNGTQQLTASDSTYTAGEIGVATFFASGSLTTWYQRKRLLPPTQR